MRILMLTQFYPPIVGGEEQHVRNLSGALAARGHTVSVVTLWHAGLPEIETDHAVRVYRVRGTLGRIPMLFSATGRRFAPPFPDPEVTRAIARILRIERPDVIHAHNWLVHSFLPLKARSGVPLVVTMHNYNLVCATTAMMREGSPCDGPAPAKCLACVKRHYGLAKGAPTLLSHMAMRQWERGAVDKFLAVSRAVAEGNRLDSSGLPYAVVPNFIPDDTAPVPAETVTEHAAYLPGGDFLLYVGALSRVKGVDVLLRAYARLSDAPPLVLIGYPMPDTPEALADLPENVSVFQDWPHDAVMHAWGRAVAGVVPSVWPEPCPTVAMEAMACAVPVVASAIGGLRDQVVDGVNGLLVPPGDVELLRSALAQLLADDSRRERMGQAAQRHIERYKAGSVVPRVEQAYADVVARTRRQGA